MEDDSTPEDLFRRTQQGIARLRESQRQLVRDIQDRYNELGMAVDQLRSYFNSSSDSSSDEQSFTVISKLYIFYFCRSIPYSIFSKCYCAIFAPLFLVQ